MIRAKNSLVVLVTCLVILAFAGIVGLSNRSQASSRVAWEYRIVTIQVFGTGKLGEPERTMNELGADGWEFLQFIHEDELRGFQGQYLFRRAK
jgi:hypothetical protein